MKATIQPQPVLLELSADEAKILISLAGNTTGTVGKQLIVHAFANEQKAAAIHSLCCHLYSALYNAGVR